MGFVVCHVTVEPLLFLYTLGFMLNLVALPQLILDNVCRRNYNESKCLQMLTGSFKTEYEKAQQEAALWAGGCLIAATSLTIFTLPTVGAISDVLGRRKALCLTPAFQALLASVFLCIISQGIHFSTWLLVLASCISGFVGEIMGSYLITTSYICDITETENRTFRLTILDAVFSIGIVVATFSSGLIIEKFWYTGVYVVILACSVLAMLYIAFVVPEEAEVRKKRRAVMAGVEISDDCLPNKLDQLEIKENNGPNEAYPRSSQDEKYLSASAENCSALTRDEQYDEGKKYNNNHILGADNVAVDVETSFCDDSVKSDNGNDDKSFKKENAGLSEKTEMVTTTKSSKKATIMKVLTKSNPIANFRRLYNALKDIESKSFLFILLIIMFFVTFSYVGEASVSILYVKNHPFYLSVENVGFFLAYGNAMVGIVGLGLFNMIIQKIFKLSDYQTLMLVAFAYIPYEILLAVASSTKMLYGIQVIHALAALASPTTRSMLSKMADDSTLGTIMAACNMVETFAAMLAGFVIPAAYAALVTISPGAVFFIIAAVMLIDTVIVAVMSIMYLKRAATHPITEN